MSIAGSGGDVAGFEGRRGVYGLVRELSPLSVVLGRRTLIVIVVDK